LFGSFLGTMRPSDFPETCTSGVRRFAFPNRPPPPSGGGIPGTSRFPCKEFPHVHRVSDGAEPKDDSRLTPPSVLPSASVNSVGVPDMSISPLNGWPVRAPVNASLPSLLPTMHDSGSVWGATPSLYGSFIHNSLPVLTGALTVRPNHLSFGDLP
jgi:hypothetical protein